MNIRKAQSSDRPQIAEIYNLVAGKVEGIVRRPSEITETYIFTLLNKPEDKCVFLVVEDEDSNILGFVHAEKVGLMAYNHILTNYTIVVTPSSQKTGIARKLFVSFLTYLQEHRSDVKRLEMEVQYNPERIAVFETLGFKVEGTIKNRFRGPDNAFHDQTLMAWENPNFKG